MLTKSIHKRNRAKTRGKNGGFGGAWPKWAKLPFFTSKRMNERRFPAPWSVEKIPGGLKVCDANGQSLAYVYSRENPNDAHMAKVLTEDEARRVASNIAKLPTLLAKGD